MTATSHRQTTPRQQAAPDVAADHAYGIPFFIKRSKSCIGKCRFAAFAYGLYPRNFGKL
jgi:hypothetical protein